MIWFTALAQEAPDLDLSDEVSEEIIVWKRPFARFDDKRWLVRTEVITPAVTPMGTVKTPIRANAWQLEVVVHCRLADHRKRLREADCEVEDAALRIHGTDLRPGGRDDVAIADQIAALRGTTLQLQANRKGAIPNVDLEGLDEDNLEKRRIATGSRTLMTQVAAAFHMEFPKDDPRGKSWVSYNEPLLLIAAPSRGMGSMEVLHRLDVVDEKWIQQTQGRSTSTTRVPNPNAGLPCAGPGTGMDVSAQKAAALNGFGSCVRNETTQPDFLELEMTYAMEIAGVAVVDRRAGYPTERVWTVTGNPTAGSPGSTTGSSYWSAGVLRELGPEETVKLGISGVIGPPGKVVEGLAPWVSVGSP